MLAFISAALRVPASLLVQPAMISAIAPASQMVGQLSGFSILGVLMDAPVIQLFLPSARRRQKLFAGVMKLPAPSPTDGTGNSRGREACGQKCQIRSADAMKASFLVG